MNPLALIETVQSHIDDKIEFDDISDGDALLIVLAWATRMGQSIALAEMKNISPRYWLAKFRGASDEADEIFDEYMINTFTYNMEALWNENRPVDTMELNRGCVHKDDIEDLDFN